MKNTKTALFCAMLAVVAAIQARANQEYDWTGGTAGYSGTVILDSNSNGAGVLGDIVSGQITTPQGTYVFDSSMVFFIQANFVWNPAQITDMWVDWNQGSGGWAGFGANYGGTGPGFVGSGPLISDPSTWSVDFTGTWTAANGTVPEGGATVGLLGGAIIALAALRRRFAK